MRIEMYDFEKGLSELDRTLRRLQEQIMSTGAIEHALTAGAVPVVNEIKNQITMKAKHNSPQYTSGKRKPGQLIKALRTELKVQNYLYPVLDIGFSHKGAHSNILENSDRKVLRHIRPAWELREEEAKSIMADELFQYLD